MLGRRRAFRYDRRRMLFTRKSAESACWSGGAAARAGGRAIGGQTTGFGWTKRPISATGPDIGTNEDVTCRSSVATTRWSQASSSWVPSSPVQQSWQTSPQSSGSSLQKQRTVPPRTAAKARAPAATSATHPRTRPLLFIIDLIIPKNRMSRRSVTFRMRRTSRSNSAEATRDRSCPHGGRRSSSLRACCSRKRRRAIRPD